MHAQAQQRAHFGADGEVPLVGRDMRGLDAAAAAAERRRGLGGDVFPAIRRIGGAAHPMQQIAERLKIGLVASAANSTWNGMPVRLHTRRSSGCERRPLHMQIFASAGAQILAGD